jgi:hypothetical protein
MEISNETKDDKALSLRLRPDIVGEEENNKWKKKMMTVYNRRHKLLLMLDKSLRKPKKVKTEETELLQKLMK